MKGALSMQNQNKSVMNIDDRDRGRKGIEEMLAKMSKLTDLPDDSKQNKKQREPA